MSATESEPAAGPTGPSTSRSVSPKVAAVVVALHAATLGALAGALAALDEHAVASGLRAPGTGWAGSCRDWVPALCIGFGLTRIARPTPRATLLLRIAAALAVGVLAVAQLSTPTGLGPAGHPAVDGALLGVVAASAWRWWRPLGSIALVAVAAVAAAAAFVLADWPAGDAQAVAFVLALASLVPDRARLRRAADHAGPGAAALVVWFATLGVGVFALATYEQEHGAGSVVFAAGFFAMWFAGFAAGRPAAVVGAALGLLVLGQWASTPSDGRDAAAADGHVQPLLDSGGVALGYCRGDQELRAVRGGEVLFAVGPDRDEAPLCTALLHLATRAGDRVMVLGCGGLRVADDLATAIGCLVDHVELRDGAVAQRLLDDGPVPAPATGAVPDTRAAERACLADVGDARRQVAVVAELAGLRATAHRATVRYQQQLRRVVGDGVVLQPVALDRVGAAGLDALFASAVRAHAISELFVVGDAAVLVSGSALPLLPARLEPAHDDEARRWALYAAHLGGALDVERARVGTLRSAPEALGGGGDVAGVLARWLEPHTAADPAAAGPDGTRGSAVLAPWLRRRASLRRAAALLLGYADDAEGRVAARRLAQELLPIGAPTAGLQAALGLAEGPRGAAPFVDPRLASRRAFALDPTFFAAAPPVFASMPRPTQACGDLEDLHRATVGPRLVELCVGPRPLATALRARFPVACARSLLDRLRERPLDEEQCQALRELADAFVLDEAARHLGAADPARLVELLPCWRLDVPAPDLLRTLAERGARAHRVALASALRGRTDASCHELIATFLLDDDAAVRELADEALELAVGDRVTFDPAWPRSRRVDAASRLRRLHNRRP